MRRKLNRATALLPLALVALGLGRTGSRLAWGEDENFPPTLPPPTPAFRGAQIAPGVEADSPPLAAPARSLFRDTSNPLFDNLRQSPAAGAGVNAGSVQFRTDIRVGNFGPSFGFLGHRFAPEDADLKIGNLYLNADYLSGTVLFSDNINLDHRNRKDGTIAIMQLGFSLALQLTESFQFAASGAVAYLPLQGKIGLVGNIPLLNNFGFALQAAPTLFSQLTWDTNLFGWPVTFFDEFTSGQGYRSYRGRDQSNLFIGTDFQAEDRAGRYAFRAGAPSRNDGNHNAVFEDADSDVGFFSNRVGVLTERFLPGEVRLRVRAYHENLWYNQGGRGLPTIRESLTATAYWERPSLRFKPFVSYDAFRSSLEVAFNQTITVGLQGPITDQLGLFASTSYFEDSRNNERLLWRVELDHEAGPYTQESLAFGRTVSFFQDEVSTFQTYRLQQVLGPRLTATLLGTHQQLEDLRNEFSRREFLVAGLELSLHAGPKTDILGSYFYSYELSNPKTHLHSVRLQTVYRFTDTLTAQLFYQYQHRDSDLASDSYFENLVILQVTKVLR